MIKKLAAAVRGAGRAFKQAYNEQGEELPDPKPIEVPLGFKKPPTLHEQIRMFIRTEEFRRRTEAAGVESFEEANDFEVGDEEFDDVPTPHEMQEEFLRKGAKDADEFIAKRSKAKAATPPAEPPAKAPSGVPDEDDPKS